MNLKEIKELLALMNEHNLAEVEYEKDGVKLKLRKSGGTASLDTGGENQVKVIPVPHATDVGSVAAAQAVLAAEAANIQTVRSPMVGSYYSAPAPDQPAYVTVGQRVKKGDVLCILEAMKLMNEIKCEIDGTITEILVNNGQPVEFDQALFKIKTS